jgi:hypothetical protein
VAAKTSQTDTLGKCFQHFIRIVLKSFFKQSVNCIQLVLLPMDRIGCFSQAFTSELQRSNIRLSPLEPIVQGASVFGKSIIEQYRTDQLGKNAALRGVAALL